MISWGPIAWEHRPNGTLLDVCGRLLALGLGSYGLGAETMYFYLGSYGLVCGRFSLFAGCLRPFARFGGCLRRMFL